MSPSDVLTKAVTEIIAGQEQIIGPVAIEQAKEVSGLSVNWPNRTITITGDATDVVEKLVEQYRNFFGQAAVEVCKEATQDLVSQLPPQQVPQLLR
jgi:hypothetical protein